MDNFAKYHSDYNTKSSIGFFPGGFKPPHNGHFAALQSMLGYDAMNPETGKPILLNGSSSSNYVYVIIGHAPRGSQDQNKNYTTAKQRKTTSKDDLTAMAETMITKEMSMDIWNFYIEQSDQSLRDKVNITISPHASPIIGMEQAILNLKSRDIANSQINLYAGAEDQSRYEYFTSEKFRMKIAEEKQIKPESIHINRNMLDRLGSATDVRSQILRVATQEADIETLKTMLPPGVDISQFLELVKTFR